MLHGHHFRNMTDILLTTSMVAMTVIFTGLIASNLKEVLSSSPIEIDQSYGACVGFTLAATLVLCSLKELINLSWMMVLAGLCEFYVIGVVYYFSINKVVMDPDSAAQNRDRYMFCSSLAKFPLSFCMRKC